MNYIILFLLAILFIICYKYNYIEKKTETFSQRSLLGNKNQYKIIYSDENNDPELDTINNFSNKSGGLRLGCYIDDISRKVPYSGGNKRMSFEDCQELAHKRKHPLFAIQDGGYCWTGIDKETAIEKGELPDNRCALKNEIYPDIQLGGGDYVNDLYITNSLPNIRMCAKFPPNKTKNDYKIQGVSAKMRGKLSEDSFILKPELGANCNHNMLNRWILYEFTPDSSQQKNSKTLLSQLDNQNKVKSYAEYCPDIDYIEFNPSACTDPSDPSSCENTPITGYIPNKSLCKTKFKPSNNNFNNLPVYRILSSALYQINYVKENNTSVYQTHLSKISRFNELLEKCSELAVNIIKKDNPNENILLALPDDYLVAVYSALKKSDNPELTVHITLLKDNMKLLVKEAKIIRGLLNLKNMGCPCLKNSTGVLKCGPC